MKKALILIDYDNLSSNQKSSIQLLIEQILCHLANTDQLDKFIKGDVRVYGGWYEEDKLTALAAQLNMIFQDPVTGKVFDKNGQEILYNFQILLAQSLLSAPTQDFWRTYRKKSNPSRGIRFSQEMKSCSFSGNVMAQVKTLITTGLCPHSDCPNYSEENLVIYRAEQKMVDTLMSCDLVYSAIISPDSDYVIVVSGDDDFYPALVLAGQFNNCSLVHVIPKASAQSNNLGVSPNCITLEIRL